MKPARPGWTPAVRPGFFVLRTSSRLVLDQQPSLFRVDFY